MVRRTVPVEFAVAAAFHVEEEEEAANLDCAEVADGVGTVELQNMFLEGLVLFRGHEPPYVLPVRVLLDEVREQVAAMFVGEVGLDVLFAFDADAAHVIDVAVREVGFKYLDFLVVAAEGEFGVDPFALYRGDRLDGDDGLGNLADEAVEGKLRISDFFVRVAKISHVVSFLMLPLCDRGGIKGGASRDSEGAPGFSKRLCPPKVLLD